MMKYIKGFCALFAFLTIIRLPSSWQDTAPKYGFWGLPIIGIILGILAVFWVGFGDILFEPSVEILTISLMAFLIIITGGLHYDGFADICDALGGRTLEKRLMILKDSRLGSFGAMGLILIMVSQFILWQKILLNHEEGVILGVIALPRIMVVIGLNTLPLMNSGLAHNFGRVDITQGLIAIFGFLALGFWIFDDNFSLILESLFFATIIWAWLIKRKFGAVNGDAIGFLIVISELVVMVCVA